MTLTTYQLRRAKHFIFCLLLKVNSVERYANQIITPATVYRCWVLRMLMIIMSIAYGHTRETRTAGSFSFLWTPMVYYNVICSGFLYVLYHKITCMINTVPACACWSIVPYLSPIFLPAAWRWAFGFICYIVSFVRAKNYTKKISWGRGREPRPEAKYVRMECKRREGRWLFFWILNMFTPLSYGDNTTCTSRNQQEARVGWRIWF